MNCGWRPLIIAALLGTRALPAVAEGASGFAISRHSQQSFSVYEGDSLRLQVVLGEHSAGDAKVKWITSGKTLCREASCEIRTDQLGLGYKIVYAILMNETDSHSIRFNFNVLKAPPGRQAYEVVPPLVDFEEAGAVKDDPDRNTTLGSLAGTAYRFTADDLEVVRGRKTPILWNEKVRVGKKGVGWVRWKDNDEHFFSENARAILQRLDGGERFVVLEEGTLRSRRLNQGSRTELVIVLAHPQIQLSLGDGADVMVHRGKDDIWMQGLRGRSYLEFRHGRQVQRLGLEAGQFRRVNLAASVIEPSAPETVEIEKFFAATTPELLDGGRSSQMRGPWKLEKADPKHDIDQLIGQQDWLLAVQELLGEKKAAGAGFRRWPQLVRAYFASGLKQTAFETMKAGGVDHFIDGQDLLLAGMVHFEKGNYEEALEHLSEAAYYYPDSPNLDYYIGIAHDRLSNRIRAEYHFKNALWNSSDADLQGSAREHLTLIEEATWFRIMAASGAFYRSSILGLKSASRSSPFPVRDDGFGTFVKYHLGINLIHSGFLEWDILYDGFGSRYLYAEQSIAGIQSHRLTSRIGLFFGRGAGQPAAFELSLEPYAAVDVVGSDRALDTAGGRVRFGMPRLPLSPALGYGSGKNVDPFPNRDDALSPVTGSYEGRIDQSHEDSRYFLQLKYLQDDWQSLESDWGLISRSFDNSREMTESYAAFSYRYHPNLRVKLGADLSYTQVESKYTDGDSDDQRLKLMLVEFIAVNPVMGLEFSQSSWINQSSAEQRDFTQNEIVIGARLDL